MKDIFRDNGDQTRSDHEGMEEESAPFIIINEPGRVDVLAALATTARQGGIHLGVLVGHGHQEEREIAEGLGVAVFTNTPEESPVPSVIAYALSELGVQDLLIVDPTVALSPDLLREMRDEMKAREGMCIDDMQAALLISSTESAEEDAVVGIGIRLDPKEGLILSTANMILKTLTNLAIGADQLDYRIYQPAFASAAA